MYVIQLIIAFLKLYCLAEFFHIYHVSVSLPVDTDNDMSDGLNDLSLYRPELYAKLRQKKISGADSFGARKTCMNHGAFFIHDHLLHCTVEEIDIPFAEEMMRATLPPHLREHKAERNGKKSRAKKVIKIRKVKNEVLDVLRVVNYIERHMDIDRNKYDRFVGAAKYGEWPGKIEDENEHGNIYCKQKSKITFESLFLLFSGHSACFFNKFDGIDIRGVIALFFPLSEMMKSLFVFHVSVLSLSEIKKIEFQRGPAHRNALVTRYVLNRSAFILTAKTFSFGHGSRFPLGFWPRCRGPGPPRIAQKRRFLIAL